MLMVEPPWAIAALPPASTWAALAGLALLSTALAYVLYFRILAAAGATNLLLVTFLVPVTSILLGALFPARTTGNPGTSPDMALIALGAGRDRRPHSPRLRARGEIAVRLHNCALGGGLFRCGSNPSNRAQRVFQPGQVDRHADR